MTVVPTSVPTAARTRSRVTVGRMWVPMAERTVARTVARTRVPMVARTRALTVARTLVPMVAPMQALTAPPARATRSS